MRDRSKLLTPRKLTLQLQVHGSAADLREREREVQNGFFIAVGRVKKVRSGVGTLGLRIDFSFGVQQRDFRDLQLPRGERPRSLFLE